MEGGRQGEARRVSDRVLRPPPEGCDLAVNDLPEECRGFDPGASAEKDPRGDR